MNGRSFNYRFEMMTKKAEITSGKREANVLRRREQILQAALECFLEHGYHQTGVRDIAKCAGVSLGNLYNHFPGKHDVLAEIAAMERSDLAPFIRDLGRDRPAKRTLEKFLKAYARYLAQPENVILSIEIASEALRKPDIAALFLANREELVGTVAQVIERGVSAGEFATRLDAREAAQLIVELIEGTAYRSVLSEVRIAKLIGGLNSFVMSGLGAE
ncbi:MAG: TetR/AcrR family transcriptional regulator [Pseudomonadota bacterium]